MSLDKATVARIAALARIKVADRDLDKMVGELQTILAWVEQLNEVDTTGIEPMSSVVEVTLRGNRDALSRVAADDLTAFIDLAGLGPGQYSLTVHADSSRDAGVTRVTPESVQVRITSGKH